MAGAEPYPVAPADAPEQVRHQWRILGLASSKESFATTKAHPQPEEMDGDGRMEVAPQCTPAAAGHGLQQSHARNADQKSLRKDRLTVPAA